MDRYEQLHMVTDEQKRLETRDKPFDMNYGYSIMPLSVNGSMLMSMNPLLYYAFAMVSLLCACSGKQGPTPPPILAAYGDFEYAEHDTTWLQQLPVVTFKSEMLFTDGELSDAGLQGAAALYPQGGDKWIVYAYNTGAYFLEKNGSRWAATRIGAVGQGPGEYENNRLAGTMVTDSTLWLNISGIRHLKYALDGQYLGESAFRSTAMGTSATLTYVTARGQLFIHASEADSMIVKYTPIDGIGTEHNQFNQCIPRPLRQTSGGMGVHEKAGYSVNEHGEGLAYLSRYPYLIQFEVDESGDCRLKGIINIDPSNSDGTPVISTTAPGSGQPAWRRFPVVHAVRPLGDCWIVSTSAMASLEHLRLCRDGTMTRVQLLDPNGDYVGMFITNTVGDIMYGSIYKDGKRWYVALRES